MLFMFSFVKNDFIVTAVIHCQQRSRLKSMKEFTPNLRVPDLRWIRYMILESRKGEMSHRVMFSTFCNASGTSF